jgi:hypothetical protein
MRRIVSSVQAGAVVATFLLSAGAARAVTANPQCVHDARQTKRACVATCQDNFTVDKDMCRNVNHDCADACRAGRATCVAPILDALSACLDTCQTALDAAKTDCRAQFAKGTAERDACIDAAQVVAFSCRDACREAVDHAALKQCRKIFHACVIACPPAN